MWEKEKQDREEKVLIKSDKKMSDSTFADKAPLGTPVTDYLANENVLIFNASRPGRYLVLFVGSEANIVYRGVVGNRRRLPLMINTRIATEVH